MGSLEKQPRKSYQEQVGTIPSSIPAPPRAGFQDQKWVRMQQKHLPLICAATEPANNCCFENPLSLPASFELEALGADRGCAWRGDGKYDTTWPRCSQAPIEMPFLCTCVNNCCTYCGCACDYCLWNLLPQKNGWFVPHNCSKRVF